MAPQHTLALMPSPSTHKPRQAPALTSTHTANPNAIIIPNGLAPLLAPNPWFFAFLAMTFLVSLPLLLGITLLAHRWRTDWRRRPERLVGDRAWEVEAFGCEACDRSPTRGIFKDGNVGLGIVVTENNEETSDVFVIGDDEVEDLACEDTGQNPPESCGAGQRVGKIHTNADGFEEVELTTLSFEHACRPRLTFEAKMLTPTLPQPPSKALPRHNLSTYASPSLADPLACQIHSTNERTHRSLRSGVHFAAVSSGSQTSCPRPDYSSWASTRRSGGPGA